MDQAVEIFCYNSARGLQDNADFYVRRAMSSKSPMVFTQRLGQKKVNCWGIKVLKGDAHQLRWHLHHNMDWFRYAMSGSGCPGTIGKADIFDAVSKFVSPLFDVHKIPNLSLMHRPHFFIRHQYAKKKPVVKEKLDASDSLGRFFAVTLYSGDLKKVLGVMEGIDWSKHNRLSIALIIQEYYKASGLEL